MSILYALGPAGTNSHEAAERFNSIVLKNDAGVAFVERNQDAFQNVLSFGAYAALPVENSIGGLVQEIAACRIRQFKQADNAYTYIHAELGLPVRHHLLVHQSVGNISQIVAALSHPQALAQCATSLEERGLRQRVAATSTAEAARLVASDPEYITHAALASEHAANVYGLKKIVLDMQGHEALVTRFHLMGPLSVNSSGPTGKDRTVFMVAMKDLPGALYRMAEVFARRGVNLSTIHSLPLGDGLGQYAFYLEADCHAEDENGLGVCVDLKKVATRYRTLGSFPRAIEWAGSVA